MNITRPRPDAVLFSADLPREHGFEPMTVEGQLPAELSGTLYRNGPGLFELFGRRYRHPFEADGAISAIRLREGRAEGAARVTLSPGLREERAAGRMLYGYSSGWLDRLRNVFQQTIKNTANTSVMGWQGRLFALMEAARPIEIAQANLATIGETDLQGALGRAFSAHPHEVPARRAIYNFGVEYGKESRLALYELPERGPVRTLTTLPLREPVMLHDFMATEHHLVFLVPPVRLQVARVLLGLGPFEELFRWQPELGTEVIVVPIDAPERTIRFRVGPCYQWHFGNGHERDGKLVIDLVRYPDASSLQGLARGLDFAPGRFHRVLIDPARQRLESREICDVSCEFPQVHPAYRGRDYRYAWLVVDKGYGLARLDVTTGAIERYPLAHDQYTSEAIFVPRSDQSDDECDGYLLAVVYDGARHRSGLMVFDGASLAAGPIARAWFDHHIPITFHGTWLPDSRVAPS